MRYDREMWRRGSRSRGGSAGRRDAASGGGVRGEYGEAYEGPFPRHGWSEGFLGGELRSRGSWEPRETDTFEWGDGYIGGRGYGGGNYDLEHGYATGGQSFRTFPPRESDTSFSSSAGRGGYARGEAEVSEEYGPARYGYGPYFDRLRRRRRSDDELRQEVEDTLFYDTWVDADAISIVVQDGVVTLRGTLPNYEELRYAVDDAWDVDGVRGVRSELDVRERESESGSMSTPARDDLGRPGGGSGRYEPGSPHMHGHPHAGEPGSSPEIGGRASGSRESAATGTRGGSSGGTDSGGVSARATSRRAGRRPPESEGDAGTPVPASTGMAASGAPGSARRRSASDSAETGAGTRAARGGRGGRSRSSGQGAGRGTRTSGASGESAGEAGDGSVGLSQS